MAYGKTRSTGLTSFVGAPLISGGTGPNPIMQGTGTKVALGYTGTAASGAITMIGDIQKAGGTAPAGSRYSGSAAGLPQSDVIKSALLVKLTTPGLGADVTDKASITADNQVTLAGLAASASGCLLLVVFDQSNKMGDKG